MRFVVLFTLGLVIGALAALAARPAPSGGPHDAACCCGQDSLK